MLKSANAYEKMLQNNKITKLYKCMSEDCYFTTNSEESFNEHINLYERNCNKETNQPHNFYTCSYCYKDCQNSNNLLHHLKKIHTYCRYLCTYCFFRAYSFLYVKIHQVRKSMKIKFLFKFFNLFLLFFLSKINHHNDKPPSIISLHIEYVYPPPLFKPVNRREIVKPFVCVHGESNNNR